MRLVSGATMRAVFGSGQAVWVAALVLLLGSTVFARQGTLAMFTASTTNANNQITLATLTLSATPNGGAPGGSLTTSIADFQPGDFILKGVLVTNTGSIPGTLTLTVTDLVGAASNPLNQTSATTSLRLTVLQCTTAFDDASCTTAVTSGSGGTAWSNQPIGVLLATASDSYALAAGASKRFRIRVELPYDATPSSQNAAINKSANFRYTWDLAQ